MKLWAIYLIVSAGITFISKLLLALSRDEYPEGIEWKAFIILSGTFIYWMAAKKVESVQEDVVDNF